MPAEAFDFGQMGRMIRAHQRRMVRRIVPLLGLIFLSLPALAILTVWFDLPSDPPGELTGKRLAVIVGWGVATVGSVFALCCFAPTPPKFACPHCGAEFVTGHRWPVVVSTGYCPECLQPLFADPETMAFAPRRANLLTRDEFQRQRTPHDPRMQLVPLVIGMLAMGGGGALAGRWDRAAERPDEYRLPAYQITAATLAAAATISAVLVQSRRRRRELERCRCPECRNALAEGPLVRITGHCTNCGAQALADPLPRPARPNCRQPLALDWYRRHGHLIRNWVWLPCLVGSIPALLWLTGVLWWNPQPRDAPVTPFWLTVMLVAPVLQLGGIGLSGWWLRTRFAPACPECRHTLADVSPVVMASRTCPFCATAIVEG